MDEEEFDSLIHSRSFRSEDARHFEAQAGRLTTLGIELWGRTAADLERHLAAPHPKIPAGVDLTGLLNLHAMVQKILDALGDPRHPLSLPLARSSAIISVGGHRFTEWEARLEIVRRAIEHFEKR